MNRSKSRKYLDEFSRYVVMEPYPFVLDLKNSRGMWMATQDGDKIFDWAGFYGSKLIGYNHPRMAEKKYLQRLITAANNKIANPDFLTPECVAYYRKLFEIAPKCMRNPEMEVYAVNSGAEAVENLSKYFINLYDARQQAKKKTVGMRRMIYFDQAFHGRTIFALNITQLTNAPVITKDFNGLILGNIRAPFPAVDSTRPEAENRADTERCLAFLKETLKKCGHEVVGIIVEPIQGAGGHRTAYPWFFRKLSEIAHEFNVSLGFDEVQTAGGQCGSFFMADTFDLPYPPQGIASGKKLANGVIYMYRSMKDVGILDSTWGGTLTDMVRFVQEMRIVEDGKLVEQVPEKMAVMLEGLPQIEKEYPGQISNIRGAGLYQGFMLTERGARNRLIDTALETEQMLLLGAGIDSIRFRPALDVTIEEIKLMLYKLGRSLKRMKKSKR